MKSLKTKVNIISADPNFLVLDEPTNHLDIETIDALGRAINAFKVMIVITINIYFADETIVCTSSGRCNISISR